MPKALPAIFRAIAFMDDVAIPILAVAAEMIAKSRKAIEIAASAR